ncbi:MAG: helix-turn-helix domain-containing protein [Pseudobdellovibrionaceae bacterium]
MSQSKKKILKDFGARVRQLRNERGWTLEETEDHGWISWRHLQQIESGQKNVTLETIIKLARLFKIHPGELFSYIR